MTGVLNNSIAFTSSVFENTYCKCFNNYMYMYIHVAVIISSVTLVPLMKTIKQYLFFVFSILFANFANYSIRVCKLNLLLPIFPALQYTYQSTHRKSNAVSILRSLCDTSRSSSNPPSNSCTAVT